MEEDQVSWGYIIVFIVLIVIIGFIFAKADNKRAMLKTIGLDLSGSVYDTLKEKEFSKRCLVALVNASLKIPQDVNGEKQFLNCLIKREFDIRTLRNKPAFVNDVDIHRRLLRQKVVRNNPCNQV